MRTNFLSMLGLLYACGIIYAILIKNTPKPPLYGHGIGALYTKST